MRLDEAPLGRPLSVVTAAIDPRGGRLLASLGLVPGAALQLAHRTAFGGRVVALGADRIALDRRTCRQIAVVARDGAQR